MAKTLIEGRNCEIKIVGQNERGDNLYIVDEIILRDLVRGLVAEIIDVSKIPKVISSADDLNGAIEGQLLVLKDDNTTA